MLIKDFGELTYNKSDRQWFGRVDNICPNNEVELSFETDNERTDDIDDKIKLVRQFALDYDIIILTLQKFIFTKFSNTIYEKSLDEIKDMYFLSGVTLKDDNKTWWLTMEPDFKVNSFYNYLPRFTMIDREVVWTN